MSVVQKLDALKAYIQSNFTYSYTESSARMYSYLTKKVDCIGASDLFGDMAKDLGVRVGYVDYSHGVIYDYLAYATANSTGHVNNAVWLDGKWVGYDAQPLH